MRDLRPLHGAARRPAGRQRRRRRNQCRRHHPHDGRPRGQRALRASRGGEPGEVALAVEGLTRRGNARDPHATVLDDVSLSGAPRRDPGHRRAGRRRPHRDGAGDLRRRPVRSRHAFCVDGKPVDIRSPRDAIRHGIGLVPEDRKQQALFLSLADPHQLSAWPRSTSISRWLVFIDERPRSELVERIPPALNIRMASPEQLVGQPVRRQPAEGRAGALAGAAAQGADRRRADARHRRRRQGRGAQSALRAGASRALPSSRSRRNCRRCWRSATASSPCARAA